MLKLLRKKGVAKKVIWVIAIVIIISFGFLGTAYLITDYSQAGYAGKIFDKKISFDDFDAAYAHVRIQALMRYGEQFYKIQNNLNLDAETWDRLILLHEAKKRRIKVENEEVIETIESYPFFHRDGQFDTLLYNDVLRFVFRTDPVKYEEGVRDIIKLKKLLEQETESVNVSDEKIFEEYKKQNERIRVSYAYIYAEEFSNQVSFTPEETEQYFKENKALFIVPESVNAQYIHLPLPDKNQFQKIVEAESPPEASDETDIAPEVLKTEKVLDEETFQAAVSGIRKRITDIHQALLINPDMQEIAGQFNTAVKSTGFISKEKPNLSLGLPYPLLNKIFELELNDITDVFEGSNGFHIVKLVEKRDSYIPEYAEAKPQVDGKLRLLKAESIARQKAEEMLTAIQKEYAQSTPKSFTEITQSLGLNIDQTPSFARGQYLPKIGLAKDFQDAAFALTEENKLSGVVSIPKGFSILYLDQHEKIDKTKFEENKAKIEEDLVNQKKAEVFNDYLAQLRIKANLEDNIAKLREQQNPGG